MRLLAAFSALALACSPLTTHVAEACGNYEAIRRAPRAMLVSSHHTSAEDGAGHWTFGRRAFVVFGMTHEVSGTWGWPLVAPMTYDNTRIMPGGTTTAQTITLVGPSGTRIVKTPAQHVMLASVFFTRDTVADAAELKLRNGDEFEIALEGAQSNASWENLEGDLKWTEVYAGYPLGVINVNGDRYLVTNDHGSARTFAL
jgi:hypothetical protein